MITQNISAEFARQHLDHPRSGVVSNRVTRAVQKLEQSYACVAEVTERDEPYGPGTGYSVRVIPKQDADMNEIGDGVQSIMYLIAEGDE